ncbi:hypothetical protein ACQVTU_32150 [Bacillus cereus]|uniref:hypothetical protein n=1 Tax=Bacillus cereus TaxID=1396 RepID=UPI003D64C35D
MMGVLKNHRDESVSVSVEELVPQEHFLRTIEATISFDFIILAKKTPSSRNAK